MAFHFHVGLIRDGSRSASIGNAARGHVSGVDFVLGLESLLAFAFGALLLGEAISANRIWAVALIIIGVALLRR